jgi:CPA2 family monovalent cation:H+ antiporter-2
VLSLILFFGQRLMRGWFFIVARRKSSELFMLNVLLITLGLAYATELAGLSLALGAFLAGMLISETEYRYQVEEDIKPFRDVLLGLFFVTVGMLLDVGVDRRQCPGWPACWRLLLAGKASLVACSRAPSDRRRAPPCAAACGCAPAASSASCCSAIKDLPLLPAVLQVVLRRWCCRCCSRRSSSSTAKGW